MNFNVIIRVSSNSKRDITCTEREQHKLRQEACDQA